MCNSIEELLNSLNSHILPLVWGGGKPMRVNRKQLELLFAFYRKSIFNYIPPELERMEYKNFEFVLEIISITKTQFETWKQYKWMNLCSSHDSIKSTLLLYIQHVDPNLCFSSINQIKNIVKQQKFKFLRQTEIFWIILSS